MRVVRTMICLSFAVLLVALVTLGLQRPARAETQLASAQLSPQAALPGWSYRRPISISNSSGGTLTDFQVKVTLNAANFNFAQAQPSGHDLRFTDSDATTLLNFWVEHYDSAGQSATLWVKVPSIPPGANSKTIFLFFGNAGAANASNGGATFEFFDDFDLSAAGYYTLSAPTTVFSNTTQGWETSAIHTLSVVQLNQDGYQYWGYYGLQAGGGNIGLARSNDLVTWDKYVGNPLIASSDDARWPQVISQGGTLYLVYNFKYVQNPSIVLRTSTDGLTFTAEQVVVPDINNHRIGNPDLFYNPNDGQFYLYWYDEDDTVVPAVYTIFVKSAATATGLASAPATTLLTSTTTLAAPDMMYFDNTYFLSTETFEGGVWYTRIWSASTPSGPFIQLPGNPVLGDGSACFFQQIFGTTLHAWYCKYDGSTWTLEHRTADLAAGRPQVPYLDSNKWMSGGSGTWSAQPAVQPDGSTGIVAQLVADPSRTRPQILQSSYTGTDYVVESSLRLISGRVLGLGARVTDQDNLYSANLYEDLDGTDNLYLYQWNPGVSTLSLGAAGAIDPNTWYKLRVTAHGTNLNVALNDIPRVTATGSAFASGHVSLMGEGGASSTTAQYNDLRVRKYASAEPVVGVGAAEGPNAVTLQSISAHTTSHPPGLSVWLLGLFVCGGTLLLLTRLAARKNPVH